VQLHLLLSSQSKLSPTRVQHLKSVDERRKSYPNQSQGIINIDFIIEMTEESEFFDLLHVFLFWFVHRAVLSLLRIGTLSHCHCRQ
jgi:hypothetical protein